ncbi:MAG TPA: sigma-70 family RNA polymerase sigma factor, partial [Thermoanaerobaculia bacterium]|nr:sigma-70 family RNA polymerase sigma factor [Thermoanaerobaculia bacterium]
GRARRVAGCTFTGASSVYSPRMYAILEERDAGGDTLRRAREGDHDAFAEIVGAHEAMVYSLAYHFFQDRSRGEEIAQDVFLQLFRNLGNIESPAHLLFWLRQVTARRCIDVMRRGKMLRPVPLEAVELRSVTRDADPLLERRLRQLVADLPEAQRLVLTLRYQEDLDPSEICRIVDMPVNTVKSHLHRALSALRKKLGDNV